MKTFAVFIFFQFLYFSNMAIAEEASNLQNLKILSMNFNAEADNAALFQKRFTLFENAIREKNLDLVLVQEAWQIGKTPCFATQVAKDLNMDIAYHFEDGVYGIRVTSIVILAKKSLHLHNIKAYKLPHSAVTVGDGQTSWVGAGQVNMLIGGNISLPNGQEAFVWTTHLYTDNSDYRVDQVKFIYEKMKQAVQEAGQEWNKAWIFFTGDLNAQPESPEMNYLRETVGLQDTWNISHPKDLGHTCVADITDPEYNPMMHNSGMFPSQYGPDQPVRIDYIYTHIPSGYSVGTTRTFTSPIDNIWMSDHYALTANFIFDAGVIQNVPSADSDMASLGSTAVFAVSDDDLANLPRKKDFTVTNMRGLSIVNNTHYKVQFYFSDAQGAVYNADNARFNPRGTVTFLFFDGGNFQYRMVITDEQNRSVAQMYGVVHTLL